MNAYGKERHAFGSPINSFGQVCDRGLSMELVKYSNPVELLGRQLGGL